MGRRDALLELDRRVVAAARNVHVLGSLSWPAQSAELFLAGWRNKQPRLPLAPVVKPAHPHAHVALRDVARRVDRADPRGRFIAATADSYATASEMLTVTGTEAFHRLSREIYGAAAEPMAGAMQSHLDAADQLLASTAALTEATRNHEADFCVTAEHVARELQAAADAFFTDDVVQVVVDSKLSSKAAASAKRIRVRGSTCFSPMDLGQLREHEAFVHSATALNGRKQPALACLSLSTPRTTATQEGLATFAELITGAIDLARLRRIALRIRAVHVAEQGGDFIDVFRYLLDAGQTEAESVRTAIRIFRGGDPRGRHVFTKDVVYLRGLIGVHTFLRRAIADNRPELINRLFVGRLCAGDVIHLDEAFASGEIAEARYVPAWASNTRALAAHLSFSVVLNQIDLASVSIDALLDRAPLDNGTASSPHAVGP